MWMTVTVIKFYFFDEFLFILSLCLSSPERTVLTTLRREYLYEFNKQFDKFILKALSYAFIFLMSCFPKNTNYLLGASLSFLYSLSYHFLTKARKLNYVFAFAKYLQWHKITFYNEYMSYIMIQSN